MCSMMRAKNRLIAVIAAGITIAVVGMTGCGSKEAPEGGNTDITASQEPGNGAPDSEGAGGGASVGTDQEQPADSQEPDQTRSPWQPIDRSRVFELFSNMTVGWNLGNTFDAIGAGNSLSSETYWGNPRTSKEMIDAISEQGFNTIRIPVSWGEHVGAAPEYRINEEWLDRVEEVVDYCLENEMYVILDTHHETDSWFRLAEEDLDRTKAELGAIWTQLAERFQDCDEHLLFEGMNEPRTPGSANEWNGGTVKERQAVSALNQVFVEAVRAVGGNNTDRCLILCTYGHNASASAMRELKIPDDPNIAVAVHLYTPYFFTFDAGEYSVDIWDGSMQSDLTSTLEQIDIQLLRMGVPVIVTEFGAVNKGNTEEVIKWIEDYFSAMNEYGLKCVWWDNGVYTGSGELFGIFDRRNLTWYSQEIADALVENAKTKSGQ